MTRATLPDADQAQRLAATPRAVHLTDDHERELLAAGWRFDGRVWWSPENTAHLPLSAWRALCGDRRRDGLA